MEIKQLSNNKSTDCANKLSTRTTKIALIRRYEGEVTKTLVHKALKFGISPNYLFGYEDIDGLPLNIILLPDKVFAGNTISIDALIKESQRFRFPGVEGEHFAFRVEGDSMEPTISEGDFVICKRVESIKEIVDGNIYVIGLDQNKVKRVEKDFLKGQIVSLILKSDNPLYKVDKINGYEAESRKFPIFQVIKKVKIENI